MAKLARRLAYLVFAGSRKAFGRGRETADQNAARLEVRDNFRNQRFRLEQVFQHMQQYHHVILLVIVQGKLRAFQVNLIELFIAQRFENVLADQRIYRIPACQLNFVRAQRYSGIQKTAHLPDIHADFAHVQRAVTRRFFAQKMEDKPIPCHHDRIVDMTRIDGNAVMIVLESRVVFKKINVPT